MAEALKKTSAYVQAIGRRKSAVAQVRVFSGGTGTVQVNDRPLEVYFPLAIMQEAVTAPLEAVGLKGQVDITVRAVGGGIHGQAEAVRLGISRALIEINPDFRTSLKASGFLTRDARRKERKKYGFKSARRAPQFSKR